MIKTLELGLDHRALEENYDEQTCKCPVIWHHHYHHHHCSSLIKQRKFILRFLFISVFIFTCFLQCGTILKHFFEYPIVINTYDVSPSLISILPGMTLCNNNRLSLKKLARRNDTIRRAIMRLYPGWNFEQPRSLIDRAEYHGFRDNISELLDRLGYSPTRDTEQATLDQWFSMRPDGSPFIEWFGCARFWSDSMDCGHLTRIDSVTNRHCTTLLHRGAMLNDLVNRPNLFDPTRETFQKQLSETQNQSFFMDDFNAKEVIKMVLDFQPEDYADLKRQIGARIVFHDGEHVASAGELDYFVTRGYRYDFHISRKDTKLLDKPYDECYDYDANHLERYKHRIEPRVPLGWNTCFQNCVVRNVMHLSKCWPPAFPYFRNDSLDPDLSIKSCRWFRGSQHTQIFYELIRVERRKQNIGQQNHGQNNRSTNDELEYKPYNQRMKTYQKIRNFCWSSCILSCRITDYTVTLTKSVWPTDVNILFDHTGRARQRRHCCALIAVKYTHYHYDVHEYMPKYEIANTIGDIGGLLGVWLGLSMVSVYRVINRLVAIFGRRSIRFLEEKKFRMSMKRAPILK